MAEEVSGTFCRKSSQLLSEGILCDDSLWLVNHFLLSWLLMSLLLDRFAEEALNLECNFLLIDSKLFQEVIEVVFGQALKCDEF